jgi:hypothetical protein
MLRSFFRKRAVTVGLAVGGTLLVLLWRIYQARGLLLPAWVDSVHHALLVRILLEQQSIPSTWGPYLPDVPFYYHFGFHLTAAALAGITGANPGRAVLLAGHLWQAALAAGIYALGLALLRDRSRAFAALLLVGFVSQMPAYYVSWGRYTLLAGLALMTFAMAAALSGRAILLAILVAATAITHYYALFLLVVFLAILFGFHRQIRQRIATGGLAGLALATPWLIRVLLHNRRAIGVRITTDGIPYDPRYLIELLGPLRNYFLLGLGIVGAWLVLRRAFPRYQSSVPGLAAFLIWSSILIGMMGPWRIGPFRPDHAALVLFVPAVLFVPEALWLLQRPIGVWICVTALVIWGAWETQHIVKPELNLVNAGDIEAINWVADNIPEDGLLLLDSQAWFSTWRGVNGGWWIEPLTGRRTIPPPVVHEWATPPSAPDVDVFSRRLHLLADLPDHLYCRELRLLFRQTGATHYYTTSERPVICPGISSVYRGETEASIFRYSPFSGSAED